MSRLPPRFSPATLFWLTLVAAISTVALLLYQRILQERSASEVRLAEAKQAGNDAVNEVISNMQKSVVEAFATAMNLKSKLGHFDNFVAPDEFAVKHFRLPEEFGGRMLHPAPFKWYWRIQIPNPARFELRIAAHGIPKQGFDIDSHYVKRMLINNEDYSTDGFSHEFEMNDYLDPAKPLEIVMIATADQNEQNGSILIRWTLRQSNKSGKSVNRALSFSIPNHQMNWMNGLGRIQSFENLIGFGPPEQDIPFEESTFDIRKPQLLMRLRGQKKIDEHNYEPEEGPTDGLMIWIVERTDPTKPSPPKVIRLPDANLENPKRKI